MLTPQQIAEIRKKTGLPEQGIGANGVTAEQRIMQMRTRTAMKGTAAAVEGNQFNAPEERSFGEKARDFAVDVIGGGKLAEGLGQSFAAPKLQRDLSAAEQEASDIDLQLVKRIQEKKGRNEDTSRLEMARMQLIEDMKQNRDVQQDFVDSLPSNEQVIGSSVRLGATAALPKVAGKISKAVGPATGVLSGIGKGAVTGAATGAIEGAVHGAGVGMEHNKDAAGVAQSAMAGAGIGTVGGAVLGGAIGGVAGKINANRTAQEEFAKQFVMPKETSKVKAEAIARGNFTDPTFLKKAEVTPSGREQKLADAVKDVVSPDRSLGENIGAISARVDEINDGVKAYVTENKVPLNMNQLRSRLQTAKGDSKLIFASDATAEKTYDAVIDEFMGQVQKGDTSGIFEARQSFDKVPAIQKLLNTQGLGENVRRQIVLDVRRAANEYVADLLPKGNKYRELLKIESYMIEAIGNAAERNASIIGKNGLQILTAKYPYLKAIVGGAAAGLGFGAVGVGSSLIGSTD